MTIVRNEILRPEPVPSSTGGWAAIPGTGTAEVDVTFHQDSTSPAASQWVMKVTATSPGTWPDFDLAELPYRWTMMYLVAASVRKHDNVWLTAGVRFEEPDGTLNRHGFGGNQLRDRTPRWARIFSSSAASGFPNQKPARARLVVRPTSFNSNGQAEVGQWFEVTAASARTSMVRLQGQYQYVCGDRADTERWAYAWDGAPYASPSYAVKRPAPVRPTRINLATEPRPTGGTVYDETANESNGSPQFHGEGGWSAWCVSSGVATFTHIDEPGPEGRSGFLRLAIVKTPVMANQLQYRGPAEGLPGEAIAVGAWLRRAGNLWSITADFYLGGTAVSGSQTLLVPATAGEFARVSAVLSPTVRIAYDWIVITITPMRQLSSGPIVSVPDGLDIESVTIEPGAVSGPHFDGDGVTNQQVVHEWLGAAGASASRQIDISDLRFVDLPSAQVSVWDGFEAAPATYLGQWDGDSL